jgi:histidine triad (HIT) family protein
VFCEIGAGRLPAVRLHEDDSVVAFLDRSPIRPGHAQIITREHVSTFEQLAPVTAMSLLALGQQLARRMKVVYGVERVAFLFTGGDVAHVHAHVVPIHESTDITSARYLVSPHTVGWSDKHLRAAPEALERVKAELAFNPEA